MRVAHIICTFPPYQGGMGNSVYYFSKALADRGHEVTVFTPSYGEKNEVIFQKNNADKFKVVRLKPLVSFGNAAVLPQLLWRLNGFDIVHLHYPFYGSAEMVLLKKILSGKKLKLILHYHMDNKAQGIKGFIFNLYRIFLLPLLARMTKIITCASLDYIKHSNLGGYYRAHPEKFKQILFGVDLNQFITSRQAQIKNKNKTILFVGALDAAHYFKGLTNLLLAFEEIRDDDKYKNITLAIVGEGNRKKIYQNFAGTLKLADSVIFYQGIDDKKLVELYNLSDLVVLPSINRGEAFGLVLLEAMACAKPVIASNLPGVRSVFKNGREGLLVKPNDVKDLANKLKIILADEKKAREMGEAGRKLVENKYTWDKVGKRLDIIYHYVRYSP